MNLALAAALMIVRVREMEYGKENRNLVVSSGLNVGRLFFTLVDFMYGRPSELRGLWGKGEKSDGALKRNGLLLISASGELQRCAEPSNT